MKKISVISISLVVFACIACDKTQQATQDKPVSTKPLQAAEQAMPEIRFEEISAKAGIDFIYEDGAQGDKWAPETMIGGVAFVDYDNDGDPDLLAVSGTSWQHYEDNSGPVTVALFRNDGGGGFTNVSTEVGLDFNGYGFGFAIGDIDDDGWQDIYITALGENRLYRNNKGISFTDVTREYHVAGEKQGYSTSAAFFDADNDGDLDLYVANYVRWNKEIDSRTNDNVIGLAKAYSGPKVFEGVQPYFFRNDGASGFREEAKASGLNVNTHGAKSLGRALGKTLGILPIDLNSDGYIDLIAANDMVRNIAFINDGKGGFVEQGEEIGLAYNNFGTATAAMGIDAAWLTDDLTLTIAMGNYASEMTSIYRLDAQHFVFSDDAPLTGIGPKSRNALTFGVLFIDLDLDGRMDMVQANGHVEPDIALEQESQSYRQPAQIFWNCGPGCARPFVLMPLPLIGDLAQPMVGRGLAAADIDNDGDIDLAISEIAGRLRLFENKQQAANNWLKLRLAQADKNKFAIGAMVEIHYDDHVQKQQLMPARSYVSQVENILTFGLGKSNRVDTIKITWPDGQQQIINDVAANQLLKQVKQNNN
ncbi:MAG: CRTAC1 family protein [Gammaproteobacteria bacterium]|jgi:hypothetical protein|nr:CRTAC1 family protein [Gammaproteobacteria bacterium]